MLGKGILSLLVPVALIFCAYMLPDAKHRLACRYAVWIWCGVVMLFEQMRGNTAGMLVPALVGIVWLWLSATQPDKDKDKK